MYVYHKALGNVHYLHTSHYMNLGLASLAWLDPSLPACNCDGHVRKRGGEKGLAHFIFNYASYILEAKKVRYLEYKHRLPQQVLEIQLSAFLPVECDWSDFVIEKCSVLDPSLLRASLRAHRNYTRTRGEKGLATLD